MRILLITKRTLIVTGLIIAAVIIGLILLLTCHGSGENANEPMAAGAVEEYELNVLAGKQRVLPVYSVNRQDKKIALTIDAAWEDDKTPFILEELKKNDIKATFYMCGFWVDKYPEHIKEIHAAGHELGNHTATHPHMSKLGAAQIQKEVKALDDKIETLVGERCKTFRAPYGEYNDSVVTTIRDMGYEVVQWSIDTVDWKPERSAQTILDTVTPKLAPGAIILCHNNGYKIKEYLPKLIAAAKEQGYEFVTVSELLLDGKTIIDVNGVQKQTN